MCSPTQAAMAGLQLGTSYGAQEGQARLQELSNEFASQSAQDAFQTNKDILIRRKQEEGEAFAQANFDIQRNAMELQAKANVAAGEAGVSGISVDRITKDIGRQSGQVKQRMKKSYENRLAAIQDSETKAISTLTARMANMPIVQQPNLLAIALQTAAPYIASGALDDAFKDGGEDSGEGDGFAPSAMGTAPSKGVS